jgi:hypothetical protein
MALLTITTAGMRALPLSLLAQAIPMLSRHELEDVVERLIDRLDQIDGDPEAEEGDAAEADGSEEEEYAL